MNTAAMWRRELTQVRENLSLVLERETQYVQCTDVPLQLVKEERHLRTRIRRLERQIEQMKPMELLRTATKLLVGPVALAMEGRQWKGLRQQLLTQASKLPASYHLDIAALETASIGLAQLNCEIRILLEAHRIEPNPGQLEALERRADQMAGYLVSIYRLAPGDAPELDALLGQAQHDWGVKRMLESAEAGGLPLRDVSQEIAAQSTEAQTVA